MTGAVIAFPARPQRSGRAQAEAAHVASLMAQIPPGRQREAWVEIADLLAPGWRRVGQAKAAVIRFPAPPARPEGGP